MFLGGTDVRKWLRYTALALAAAVLVTVAAGCEVYLERRGAVTTPACELRNGYPSVAAVDGGALLWTEHRARRAQRFFRCSA